MDVKTTLSPAQNTVGPFVEIIGVSGSAFTVTAVDADTALHPLESDTITLNVPVANTVMDCVVSPVFHRLLNVALEVSITLSPAQNTDGPFSETVGVFGNEFTVTLSLADWA